MKRTLGGSWCMNVYMIHVSYVCGRERKTRENTDINGRLWKLHLSCHEIDVTIAFFIQELEECPGISGTQVQRLEHGTDFVLFKESPWFFSLSCEILPIHTHRDPGTVVKSRGTASALPEKIQ